MKSDFIKIYEELNELNEAIRIISDPNILYHYTNPTPLYKILTSNCLRADVNLEAVCLTTDKNYIIYGYPCGMQFSRDRLVKDGYELVEFDEFEWDTESYGESEERIYKNIDNVTKYITHVYINWDHISVVQSAEGDLIADAAYDENGDEYEVYELKLEDFQNLLNNLRMKGIKVIERGGPAFGEYYLDSEGKLQYGKMSEKELVAV